MTEQTPLVWFVEWRKRWLAVCPLRCCPWFTGGSTSADVEKVAGLHAAVCPGRPAR